MATARHALLVAVICCCCCGEAESQRRPPQIRDDLEDIPSSPAGPPLIPRIQDEIEDELYGQFPQRVNGTLIVDRWRVSEKRCCSPPAAPLVVDTHMHVWNEDPRPNRGLNQLGLLEDVLTEGWGEGVHRGVLVQPGFRNANNSYILRSLQELPGRLLGEVEYVIDYSNNSLALYDYLGVRALRFKATSLLKYETLVRPRLESPEFLRIASFMKNHSWHYGVQLAKEVNSKWKPLLAKLQETGVPIIIDMFGRPDPELLPGEDVGTQAIVTAAGRPAPASKIWIELGGPFRIDPRCTYAEPDAADPTRCLPKDRVMVPRRVDFQMPPKQRMLCCPPKTHSLLVKLAQVFIDAAGKEYILWGTDWPFISDLGVTTQALLDVMTLWVPDNATRKLVLGENAVRPNTVYGAALYPFAKFQNVQHPLYIDARNISPDEFQNRPRMLLSNINDDAFQEELTETSPSSSFLESYMQAVQPRLIIHDELEDDHRPQRQRQLQLPPSTTTTTTMPMSGYPIGLENTSLIDRWNLTDRRCCTINPNTMLIVDTHMHVWDEDPRPNRGLNQLGLLEDVVTEGWGNGVQLSVLVQPGFRDANNTYILRSLERLPGRLAGEVEHVTDYSDAELKRMHDLGVRGLRFKATSLAKYAALIRPRLDSVELPRIVKFLIANSWHWGVQLAKEVAVKWDEILNELLLTQVPVIIDMFGRPDPLVPAGQFIGTQAILRAARRFPGSGRIWMEFGAPFRVDPRCTYAVPEAANPMLCLPEDRVNITQFGSTEIREVCCPPATHQLLIDLAQIFTREVGQGFVIWGTDWPFISDEGVTIRGLIDAVHAWIPDPALLERVLGTNAVRPQTVGSRPLFDFIDGAGVGPVPPDRLVEAGLPAMGILAFVVMFISLALGCLCEGFRKVRSASDDSSDTAADILIKSEDGGKTSVSGKMQSARQWFVEKVPKDWEPIYGPPPEHCTYSPILGDFIAGGVKAISELVGVLTFASLMAPDELQAFLPVFLNYAVFGFIVSQIYYNLVSKYTTPCRTCNLSAAIFFLEVLAVCKSEQCFQPDDLDVAVNTLLMAGTLMTWFAGAILWVVGTFQITKFVRFLSSPVKLGMQGSLGYFLFATSFSISSGVSWLNFKSPSEFSQFFELDILPKWVLTLVCAGSVFFALNKWGWPYTIPTFVFSGIAIFHIIILSAGVSVQEATDTGWLYPPPAPSDGNPFSFIGRIYNIREISWPTLWKSFPSIATAAVVAPFLSAIINLILFESAFPPEEIGKSTLSYEIRQEGMVHWILCVIGGYSTSASAGGTAVHRKIGARTNWGLFTSVAIHTGFLLIPGSTDVLQICPKYVVAAVSLIVAISLLDSGIRGGFKTLSVKEFTVVASTVLISMLFGLANGIFAGVAYSFALFIQETAATVPLRLDVDAGLVSSHAVWGMQSSRLMERLRGGIRLLSFQGYLFFAAIQPTLTEAIRDHVQQETEMFLVMDFSQVTGMDDSSGVEFSKFATKVCKAGVSMVFCGLAPAMFTKLIKAGVVNSDDVLTEEEDLIPVAQRISDSLGHMKPISVGTCDAALELCEMTLVLRCMRLCPDVIPPAPNELVSLGKLLDTELARFRKKLQKGEQLERRQGETFILTSGSLRAHMDLRDLQFNVIRPEAITVLRSVPGIQYDYCFGGIAHGTITAVEDSIITLLPQAALTDLHSTGRWQDTGIVWSQLAEFMATTTQSMAMKATMHDVRGTYSSTAAQAFVTAWSDFEEKEGHTPCTGDEDQHKALLHRILVGLGAGDRSKLIESLPEGPPQLSGEFLTPGVSAVARPHARSRTSSADSGPIYTGLDDGLREAPHDEIGSSGVVPVAIGKRMEGSTKTRTKKKAREKAPGTEPEKATPAQWAVDQSYRLCGDGDEEQYIKKAKVLEDKLAPTLTAAVELLNSGFFECPAGFCIAHSNNEEAFYVLYATGKMLDSQEYLGIAGSLLGAGENLDLQDTEDEDEPKPSST